MSFYKTLVRKSFVKSICGVKKSELMMIVLILVHQVRHVDNAAE